MLSPLFKAIHRGIATSIIEYREKNEIREDFFLNGRFFLYNIPSITSLEKIVLKAYTDNITNLDFV